VIFATVVCNVDVRQYLGSVRAIVFVYPKRESEPPAYLLERTLGSDEADDVPIGTSRSGWE